MTLTRSKRMAEEPLLTLSAAKMHKRRKVVNNVEKNLNTVRVEEAPHQCAPSCFRPKSRCSLKDNIEEEDIDTSDLLNTSDHNENEIDVSAEMESIDGDDELDFEATELIEENVETENSRP